MMPGMSPGPDPLAVVPLRHAMAHCLWRRLPPVWRRRVLARVGSWLAPHPPPLTVSAAHGLMIAGEMTRASGLGEGARLMAEAARGLGLPVWTRDILPLEDAAAGRGMVSGPDASPPPGVPLVLHVNAPMLPLALLRLGRAVTRHRPIIGYWAWELQTVPPEWRPAVACVNQVWIPSRFTAAALEPLLPGRVRIVPPPLAVVPPVPAALDRTAFGLPHGALVVLVSFSLASSFARKNLLAALAAFHVAFGDRADRIPVLKVNHAEHAPADFACLKRWASSPNIRLETRTLPAADCHALTACADIVLSLHRAEGFGLVMAEAMLLGKPVIATGWSGNTDFMHAGNAVLISAQPVPARDSRAVYRGAWAEPDVVEAAERLRALADDPALRQELGRRARASILAQLDAQPLAAALRGLGIGVTS
jgi:glycosyltransferase involved in cell wall biosynthesis